MPKVLVNTENLSRQEWLEYRKQGIGGSDAATILGLNRYKSPHQLFMEKKGMVEPDEPGEPAYWGQTLEAVVRNEFEKRTGLKVVLVNKMLQHHEHDFMICNVDGVCMCPTHGRCVFEAKTASAYKAIEWEGDSVPGEYIAQIQHYLAIMNYKGAYVAALIGGNSFQWKFVPRDDEMISLLKKREYDFWEHIKNDVPPLPDGSDACAQYLAKRYHTGNRGSKVILPTTASDLIRQYTEVSAQIEQLTQQKQLAGNLLKDMLGENEVGTVGDDYIAWRMVSQTRFDTKAFESEQPELYRKYLRSSSHRRFTVKAAATAHEISKIQETSLRKAG